MQLRAVPPLLCGFGRGGLVLVSDAYVHIPQLRPCGDLDVDGWTRGPYEPSIGLLELHCDAHFVEPHWTVLST